MKKTLVFLLTLAILCSLSSCGVSVEPTFEEKVAGATQIDWETLGKEVSANTARAKANYEGKYFLYTGTVDKIEEDYCVLIEHGNDSFVNVYLSADELIQLNAGDKITVVGKLMDVNYKVLRMSSLVEILPVTENVEQAVVDFATYDSMVALEVILDKKDELPQATADDMVGLSRGRMIERTQYYSNTDGKLSSVAYYRATVSIHTDGTGETIEPGNEDIKWKFENGIFYFISTSEDKPLTDEVKNQYDVRLLTINDETIFVCYGMADTAIRLFIPANSSFS